MTDHSTSNNNTAKEDALYCDDRHHPCADKSPTMKKRRCLSFTNTNIVTIFRDEEGIGEFNEKGGIGGGGGYDTISTCASIEDDGSCYSFNTTAAGLGKDMHHRPEHLRPILVGYAFGPKKMSTMGVVMAEASKAVSTVVMAALSSDLISDSDQGVDDSVTGSSANVVQEKGNNTSNLNCLPQREEEFEHTEKRSFAFKVDSETGEISFDQKANASAIPNSLATPIDRCESTTPVASRRKSTNSESDRFSIRRVSRLGGNDMGSIRNIIRIFRSSCSSAASTTDSSVATMSTDLALPPSSSSSLFKVPTTDLSGSVQNFQPVRVSFVPLDLDYPLEEQHGGQFDAILHKITEDILLMSQLVSETGDDPKSPHDCSERLADCPTKSVTVLLNESDEMAVQRVKRLSMYKKEHPACCLVDHPRHVQALMSRSDIARTLSTCLDGVTTKSGVPVRTPRYHVLTSPIVGRSDTLNLESHDMVDNNSDMGEDIAKLLTDAPLSFPLIAKPRTAAGTKGSHLMTVVLGRAGLSKVPVPCLLQEYANHDGVLYKVYVLGDTVKVFPRPSLPNLPMGECSSTDEDADQKCFVEFDSQRPYPTISEFGVENISKNTKSCDKEKRNRDCLEKNCSLYGTNGKVNSQPILSDIVTADNIQPVADALRKAFCLELFGFDILVASNKKTTNGCEEKELLVVDVNYFPSYKEVFNFPSLLAQFLAQRAIEGRLRSLEDDEE